MIDTVKLSKKILKTAAITIGAILLTGVCVYALTKNYYEGLLAQAHPIFIQQTQFKLLHPLIGIALPSDQFSNGFPDVRNDVRSIIASQPTGAVSRYAFYLRDLNSGNWSGINENVSFDPASLLKVVVAIAAYRQAENQPSYLSAPLTYTPALAQVNAQLSFALPSKLQVGRAYSVTDLIKKALADSDNGAVYTLIDSIPDTVLSNVYQDLAIPQPSDNNSVGYQLTALEYSRFFRILYNGTLNVDWSHSEKILEDLATSTFTSGLMAGIPANITVAHKYGEHVNGANGVASGVELSDCGIVYYPEKPYFICVMVQGTDQQKAADVIGQISKAVYQKMSAIQ